MKTLREMMDLIKSAQTVDEGSKIAYVVSYFEKITGEKGETTVSAMSPDEAAEKVKKNPGQHGYPIEVYHVKRAVPVDEGYKDYKAPYNQGRDDINNEWDGQAERREEWREKAQEEKVVKDRVRFINLNKDKPGFEQDLDRPFDHGIFDFITNGDFENTTYTSPKDKDEYARGWKAAQKYSRVKEDQLEETEIDSVRRIEELFRDKR
jgi:hypothetical protein